MVRDEGLERLLRILRPCLPFRSTLDHLLFETPLDFLIYARAHTGSASLSNKIKNHPSMMSDFLWCAMRDLNPHGRPLDPKSSASANSANRAHVAKGLCLCGKPFTVSIKKRNLGFLLYTNGDSTGNRTPVTAVKGRCLDRLTMEPY